MKKNIKLLAFKLATKIIIWLISTLKFKKIDEEDIKIFSSPCVIVALHEEAIFSAYLGREVAIKAYKRGQAIKQLSSMVSSSGDGNIIATVIYALFNKIFYTKPYLVRGSSNKNPLRSLVEFIKVAKISAAIIIADGPRGPRGKVKVGAIITAMKNNIPIYCYRFHCKGWRINSWDKTIVPRPFQKIHTNKSGPFYFDESFDRQTACEMIENELHNLKKS